MAAKRVTLLVLALAMGSWSTARGEARPRVDVRLDPCLPMPEADVRRIVAAELGALLTETAGEDPDVTRVEVGCEDDAVALRIYDPITGKSMERSIALPQDSERGAARLVALAVAELVAASWVELTLTPEPAAPPPREARASEPAKTRARRAVEQRAGVASGDVRLTTGAVVRAFVSGSPILFGGLLRVAHDPYEHFGWAVDVQIDSADWSAAPGSVDGLLASAGGTLMGHVALSWLSLRAGAGLRLGVARLSAEPDTEGYEGRTVVGAWGGPVVAVRLVARPVGRGILSIGGEGGYTTFRVDGQVAGSRNVTLEGVWLAATAAFGLAL